MQTRILLSSLFVVAALAACGTAEGPAQIAESTSPRDEQALMPAGDCPPATGNAKGVGAPCTPGGGQCRGTGAPYCTLDVQSNAPFGFCTKMCFNNEQCGSEATCAQNPSGPPLKGCVPNACL